MLALEGYTRIAVSHKLYANILSEYDSIIAMRDGVIEECGTFDELMEKKGYFYSLYRIVQPEEIEKVEEPVSIRRRRA